MQRSLPVLEQRRFGETMRRDPWWLQNVVVVVVFSSFLIYGTWAALQNANYFSGPYLSPFYSPEIWAIHHTRCSDRNPAGGRDGCRSHRRC